jgi:hypothetical protein
LKARSGGYLAFTPRQQAPDNASGNKKTDKFRPTMLLVIRLVVEIGSGQQLSYQKAPERYQDDENPSSSPYDHA